MTNILHQYEYDNGKLLTSVTHQIDQEDPITLSHQNYDELGRLKRKYLHGNSSGALQTINFSYNIPNWLPRINDVSALGNDMFAMEPGFITGTNTKSFFTPHSRPEALLWPQISFVGFQVGVQRQFR